MALPDSFPALPGSSPFNGNVVHAVQAISDTYNRSLQFLRDDDNDPLRLQFHFHWVKNTIFPWYTALSTDGL